ncbi:fucosyltransferase 2 [Actinidia rufa]|uniref:Fucosyltransferase n=1 Tax=Actinidia rufa TaxID=165716 RepID=A0A7J0GMS0_9ERIC|nr:fucosyltransferase 2 [Actinidia rufa]
MISLFSFLLVSRSEDYSSQPIEVPKDKLLGGLLATGFDEKSYLSRYQSVLYGKALIREPSSYLISRILTLASAFLYAFLTNRVLLVDHGADMINLFCEPFPENNSTQTTVSSFLYLHLVHDYDDQDKLFFCDKDQTFMQHVAWLIMKTDNYFIPSLLLIPSFEKELRNLFPEKGTVFHFLGRYLFHPTNQAWDLITRYYQAYLAKADEKIGIQIRVFEKEDGPYRQHTLDQILACTLKENLLPEINPKKHIISPPGKNNTKAVLLSSLNSGYFEKNVKVWSEMYLLSLTDKLVTNSWSTFGYVAQGLGGLKPWILIKTVNETAPHLIDEPFRWNRVSTTLPSMTVRIRKELTLGCLFLM